MISTYLGFTLINRDIKSSLDKVASQTQVKRESDYYNAHIGKVETVDDLMDDYRLYSYAVKAYGLDDMGYAKAFMKKVLESDLSDPNSFANRLNDQRYKDFAAAFNFGSTSKDVQSDAQEDELIGLYKQSFTNEEGSAKTESAYFRKAIAKVTNVNELLNDDRLRNYALDSLGIDATYVSKSFLKQVLTSDVNDPASFVNTNGNAKYKALAAQFSFNADGTVANGAAQTAAQTDKMVETYNITVPSFTTKVGAQYNKAYYEANILSVRSIDDLVKDPRLFSYVKAAYSIDPALSAAGFKAVMASDISDPKSYANQLGYAAVVPMFNFAADGTVPAGQDVQTAEQVAKVSANYTARYDDSTTDLIDDAVKNFKKRMDSGIVKIKDLFVSNRDDKDAFNNKMPELTSMALRAYGIDESEVSKTELRKILTSDPYDPKSYVNSLKDDRFVKLAKAFNFDSKGNVSVALQALSANQMSALALDYSDRKTMSLEGPAKDDAVKAAKKDIAKFEDSIGTVKSVSDLLGNKDLVSFMLAAKGLDPKKYTADVLKQAFAADPDDPKSILNKPENAKLRDLVTSFNFDEKGQLSRDGVGVAQNASELRKTGELYLRQTLELEQGESNEGIRLALYFERNADRMTSIYDLMGDRAMFQVITTTFNLPSSISGMDVDQQAKMLKKIVNIEDLHDPKKLDKMLKRFAAMYDVANNTDTTSSASTALSILMGGAR
ncbi:DUF1217 domain-containing protein [Rhizobium sp. BK251]|uniref:DUF1217 domain-containing protein n=1 Tax=Rhizobium sp. BK251 TaxID=2512125 RepID=UPI00104A52C2|nr:DUF1217 domain-containing protein [Rhizobium sp. BK251]TCL75876.1 uncharacterized protein DUF1217 [Rhizobium sp. BK251]